MAPHIVTVVAAAITAAATALALSSRFPIGLARRLDPDVGFHVDWAALAIGVAVTIGAVIAVCGLAAWRAVRRLTPRRRMPRTQLVGAVTRAGASVPVAVGTSMALEPAPARAGATARPALVAAVVGVLGIVGAVTLVGGIDDALNRPERVGQTWDIQASPASDPSMFNSLVDAATTKLAGDRDVDAFAQMWRSATFVSGKGDVPLYAIRDLGGSMHFALLEGRAPAANGEVALGPRTASTLHAHIGDTVTVGPSADPVKVVGITLLAQTPHTSFDEGGLLTPEALAAYVGIDPTTTDGSLLVRLRRGASVETVQGDLDAIGFYTEQPSVPPDVVNLGNVRNLPLYLAAFLLLLAIGAIAHALLTGARSRSHDLAVLRALGLTPRQAAACVVWQATIIGIVALAIGIPLGVVVGREVWRVLADSLSFVYVGPLAGAVLVLIVPAALVLVGVMALWPARGAARFRTAEVLRTE